MIEYSIKKVDEYLLNIKEYVNSTPNFAEVKLNERLQKYEEIQDYVGKYDSLISLFGYCGRNYLIAKNDVNMFKGYYYLAAKAGEICFRLAEKGYTTYKPPINENLKTRRNIMYYAKYAILSNSRELAIRIVLEDSLLGAILLNDYERAKGYLPEKFTDIPKDDDTNRFLWTIVYLDEKKMNCLLEKNINRLRRLAKTGPAVCFEDFGLTIIKLAKERGMNCTLKVAELPWHLLDDICINEAEWIMPEDKELEKIFAS